jgi:hypothetical protein
MPKWPDISFFIFILSWIYISQQFHKNKNAITSEAIQNKFILYLLILSYLLNAFFITLIFSLSIIILFVIVKLVILEQVSVDGIYPYSTEKILRNILGYVLQREYLLFYFKLFVLLNVFIFLSILFIIPEEKDKSVIHSQIETILNTTLFIIILSYIIWGSYTDNELLFYIFTISIILLFTFRFVF